MYSTLFLNKNYAPLDHVHVHNLYICIHYIFWNYLGKTMTANAVANHLKKKLLLVTVSDSLNHK